MSGTAGAWPVECFGVAFQNPILLAAGTAGFGREVARVVALEALGGLVTKAVSVEPRHGNPAPRLAETRGAMLNSVGLANPGLDVFRRDILPWLAGSPAGRAGAGERGGPIARRISRGWCAALAERTRHHGVRAERLVPQRGAPAAWNSARTTRSWRRWCAGCAPRPRSRWS